MSDESRLLSMRNSFVLSGAVEIPAPDTRQSLEGPVTVISSARMPQIMKSVVTLTTKDHQPYMPTLNRLVDSGSLKYNKM